MKPETTRAESEEVKELLDVLQKLLEQFQFITEMYPRSLRLNEIHERHMVELSPGYILGSIENLANAYEVFVKYRGNDKAAWLEPRTFAKPQK